ncbi:hypothetical protein PPSIR1_24839 [Plesiocystis pacifica SIR-1]|uniref:Uncharacterized protein n=1 Tax=Plesiocystis pacifica SIR-1 TaxID=391625 RepID=A6G9G2_9BACT|nr:hypothetical protein [Plesiocystis pacifica]EDM77470.1 hypothetical protein PPSIR1_24839 [Plesiocystis pacifica SIR-1]
MSTLQTTLSPHLGRATKIVLIHRRSSEFRMRGVWEVLLMLFALPFVVVYILGVGILMIGGGAFGGGGGGFESDGGGGGSGRSSGSGRGGAEVKVSRFRRYFATLEVRLLDKAGTCLAQHSTRIDDAGQADRFVAEVLELAAGARLLVEERAAVSDDPHAAGLLAAHWYGGRPLMAAPQTRNVAELEEALALGGFVVERDGSSVVISRQDKIIEFGAALFQLILVPALIGLGALAFTAQFGPFAPFVAVALIPMALVALVVKWAEVKTFLLEIIAGLLFAKERHRLELRPDGVHYRGRVLWSMQRMSTKGSALIGLQLRGTLTHDRAVDYEPAHIYLVSQQGTMVLPERFAGNHGPLLHAWLLAVLGQQLEAQRAADPSSRCAYCGSLYDWATTPNCPGCGAAHPMAHAPAWSPG